jgi:gas vesicle structural protein
VSTQGRQGSAERRRVAAARREQSLEGSHRRREASRSRQAASQERGRQRREIALIDLIDRLLDGGVVIHGDITLAVADVDLLYVGLRALVASVETVERDLGVSLSARGASLGAGAL